MSPMSFMIIVSWNSDRTAMECDMVVGVFKIETEVIRCSLSLIENSLVIGRLNCHKK